MTYRPKLRVSVLAAVATIILIVSPRESVAQTFEQRLDAVTSYEDVVTLVNDLATERGLQVDRPLFTAAPVEDEGQIGRLVAFNVANSQPVEGEPVPGQFFGLLGVAGGENMELEGLPSGVYEVRLQSEWGGEATFNFINVDTGAMTSFDAPLDAILWVGPKIKFSLDAQAEPQFFPPAVHINVTVDFGLLCKEWKKTFKFCKRLI